MTSGVLPFALTYPRRGTAQRRRITVIGHRGACGYRPEHTLASYELAARMGADYIEPDLVSTRDHVLVARHENELARTTDVAARPEFAVRRTTRAVDGKPVTGWFTEDFTVAELKTLHVLERLPQTRQRNTVFHRLFEIPTLDEIVALCTRLSRELRRPIGLCAELKHPTYFRGIDRPLEPLLVRALRRQGWEHRAAPVIVQSFDASSLRLLRTDFGLPVRLVFLTEQADHTGLDEVAGFVDGIGPHKDLVIPRRADGTLGAPSGLVADAHRAGLFVHPWTFRAENQFLPTDLRAGTDPTGYGNAVDEQSAFLRAGVDGLITDHPDIAVLARDLFTATAKG